jgi:hypothetical protein
MTQNIWRKVRPLQSNPVKKLEDELYK